MIKWLKEINVIPYETKNHYHYVSAMVDGAAMFSLDLTFS